MNILIVDDEEKIAQYLNKGLKECGYTVKTAHTGTEGKWLAQTQDFDLIILDVMLPDINGWEVLKGLRSHGNQTPVLFLSARDSVEDRVKGLELGANDYLVKPFSFSELLARVRTILRYAPNLRTEIITVADMELNLLGHSVRRSGQRIDLTPKEFALLTLLALRPGEVFSRTRIAERVWNLAYAQDSNLVDVHIRRLRSKFDDPFEIKLIHTVRGAGYVFEHRPGDQ
jgi:two-component system, OmpR family, copper resistance phosphate regulon response regulator CusR